MSDMIKDLLCNEENGIYFRLREGDYRLEETEKIKILDYAKEVNARMRERAVTVDDFTILYELLYLLHNYSEDAAWADGLISDIYDIVMTEAPLD